MKAIRLFSTLLVLATFTSSAEVRCSYETVNFYIGSFYTCRATAISVENASTVTDISGTHMEGRTKADVKGFSMAGNEILAAIPDGIEKFFENLQNFEWSNGILSTIDSSTFEAWPNLTYIDLSYNKLVTIDGDLFQFTRKLQWISFYDNKIEHVEHDLLSGLTDLEWVNFQYNHCINRLANIPQQIQELNLQLPLECPPLATPDPPTTTATTTAPDPPTTTISTTTSSTTGKPNDCPIRCTINEEADEMKKTIAELQKQYDKLEKFVKELQIPICDS